MIRTRTNHVAVGVEVRDHVGGEAVAGAVGAAPLLQQERRPFRIRTRSQRAIRVGGVEARRGEEASRCCD